MSEMQWLALAHIAMFLLGFMLGGWVLRYVRRTAVRGYEGAMGAEGPPGPMGIQGPPPTDEQVERVVRRVIGEQQ